MHSMILRSLFSLFVAFLVVLPGVHAQISMPGETNQGTGLGNRGQSSPVDVARPVEYTIGGITVSGNRFLDEDLLLAVTGLNVGGKVRLPNDESIARAIRNLW